MAIPCYLAMTAAEIAAADQLPTHTGWLACHFSSYSSGLSNLPQQLPADSMIIINDRTPLHGHDPEYILDQCLQLYESLSPACFLLDLQRPGELLAEKIGALLAEKSPCPVGITAQYGKDLSCPVFLPPPPMHAPLEEYLLPWKDRPIWLEAVTEGAIITVDSNGCTVLPHSPTVLPEPIFMENTLHFLYHTRLLEHAVEFQLLRDRQCLQSFLACAENLGVSLAAGLYQLHKNSP